LRQNIISEPELQQYVLFYCVFHVATVFILALQVLHAQFCNLYPVAITHSRLFATTHTDQFAITCCQPSCKHEQAGVAIFLHCTLVCKHTYNSLKQTTVPFPLLNRLHP
jgi:hypothetical protein